MAFPAAISSSVEGNLPALTHDSDATRALVLHWFPTATRPSEGHRQLRKSFRQHHLSHSILKAFGLLFDIDGLARNEFFENCHFPTINPDGNFYFHGVPSLGLRGSKPLVAGFIHPSGYPCF
jgi:hypothetical protein